jgi:hypothetical protein
LGFVFESLGKGHLSINYKGICCEIKKGKITWLNLERLDTEKFFNNDPFSDEMQKIFDHDNPFNESFLYNPMLDGIKRAELAGRGATIICTTDKNAEKLNLIPKIGVNIQFTSFCWRDPLKRNYFYNRISDFIFYFSQIDGAVLITNTAIKGYGVKIRQKIKTILPKEFKNKGMRHQSAYSLVKSSSGYLFVFVVSSDGGILFLRKEQNKPKKYHLKGSLFLEKDGYDFDHLAFSHEFS